MPVKRLTLDILNREFEDKPVTIVRRGKKLSLVATLPARDGSKRRQQRISLGLGETQIELEEARARAYELFTQIVRGTFSWAYWDKVQGGEYEPTAELIERFHQESLSRGMSRDRWYAYSLIFKRLPQDKPLTGTEIIKLIKTYEPDSSARRQACTFLTALAKFAEIDVNLKPYHGNYGPAKVKARELPTDEEVEELWAEIPSLNRKKKEAASVQWLYGMMATYGLRDHETMFCTIDPEPPYVCRVMRGKTGDREVFPIPPEWVHKFDLLNEKRPAIVTEGRSHKQVGNAVSKKLRTTLSKSKNYHHPYDYRHAYAIRGELLYGLGASVMAKMLGHSVKVHVETYKRWLSKHSVQKQYMKKVGLVSPTFSSRSPDNVQHEPSKEI